MQNTVKYTLDDIFRAFITKIYNRKPHTIPEEGGGHSYTFSVFLFLRKVKQTIHTKDDGMSITVACEMLESTE